MEAWPGAALPDLKDAVLPGPRPLRDVRPEVPAEVLQPQQGGDGRERQRGVQGLAVEGQQQEAQLPPQTEVDCVARIVVLYYVLLYCIMLCGVFYCVMVLCKVVLQVLPSGVGGGTADQEEGVVYRRRPV